MYQILIHKLEPKSEEQLESEREERGRDRYAEQPTSDPFRNFNRVKQLETVLTDEEFSTVKKSVIEVM